MININLFVCHILIGKFITSRGEVPRTESDGGPPIIKPWQGKNTNNDDTDISGPCTGSTFLMSFSSQDCDISTGNSQNKQPRRKCQKNHPPFMIMRYQARTFVQSPVQKLTTSNIKQHGHLLELNL